jgi:AcrR family transcriptional regulator
MQERCKDELVKKGIIEASQKLFQRYGLKKVTMEDISGATSKGRSTIYYYYKNKDEIFDAVIEKECTELFSTLKNEIDAAAGAEQKLSTYIGTKVKLVKEKANLYAILRGEMKESPQLKNKIRSFFQSEINMVYDILSLGIDKSEFKHVNQADAPFMAQVVCSALRGVEEDIFLENLDVDDTARITLFTQMLIKALK